MAPTSPAVMTRCTDRVADVAQPGGWSLVCDCTLFKTKQTCTHIAAVIVNRQDALAEGFPDHTLIWVPVFRSPYPLSIPVRLDEPEEPTGFRRVHMVVKNPAFKGESLVGWVERAAARKEIRTILIEALHDSWLRDGEGDHCDAPQHFPGQPFENRATTLPPTGMTPPAVLIDHYFIITSGQCLACATDSGVPDI